MIPMFYVTFGLEYGSTAHDAKQHAHPEGFVTIAADNRDQAKFMADYVYGAGGTANVYTDVEFNGERYPLGELAHFIAGQEPETAPDVLVTENGKLLILGVPRVWTPGEATKFANDIADAAVRAVERIAAEAADAARLAEVGVKRHDDMW
ncbi:hypothetical protein SEA_VALENTINIPUFF_85 [Microbacterium phage ValentiniPuff]|uniref:Uncharacterized protein n=1 Tax=Microbacterium phage ValentiniPuff TaxID=2315705 RepID=A0A386KQ70_9CAUD|nr:hypothetical protein SEA_VALENTINIPUFF_85 [Microbacterium phage ValentiniPuff]